MADDYNTGSRPLVMLVEDHADTRLMYMEFLRPEYDVVGVGDGLAALQAINERRPDVIVTDFALPRMDGFELIARLRADERFKTLPIVALSGFSGPEHGERVAKVHPVTVLQKPCLPEALVEEIEKLLGGGAGKQR